MEQTVIGALTLFEYIFKISIWIDISRIFIRKVFNIYLFGYIWCICYISDLNYWNILDNWTNKSFDHRSRILEPPCPFVCIPFVCISSTTGLGTAKFLIVFQQKQASISLSLASISLFLCLNYLLYPASSFGR